MNMTDYLKKVVAGCLIVTMCCLSTGCATKSVTVTRSVNSGKDKVVTVESTKKEVRLTKDFKSVMEVFKVLFVVGFLTAFHASEVHERRKAYNNHKFHPHM